MLRGWFDLQTSARKPSNSSTRLRVAWLTAGPLHARLMMLAWAAVRERRTVREGRCILIMLRVRVGWIGIVLLM